MNDINQTEKSLQKTRIVQIKNMDRKGVGVGDTDTGGKLKVPYTIPGETVEAQKLRRRDGALVRVCEPSPHRVEPLCSHFGVCGGCIWQHIDYAYQLQIKREKVVQRFSEHDISVEMDALEIVSGDPFGYRNRMDFLWWYDGRFGLRERGKWYSAVDLAECRLLHEPVMNVALEVNRRIQESGLVFRDGKKKRPGLRYLVIRRGVFTGNVLLSFVTDPMDLSPSLWEGLNGVSSVYQLVNDNLENDLSDGEPIHLWGEPYYRERIGERVFRVGPRSFFQPNPAVAVRMVEHVREIAASLDRPSGLIDLYCGIGLFTISLSDCFERAIGVENSSEAVALAKFNAGDSNIQFACVDAEKWEWPDLRNFNTLLIDPPRMGLHPRVLTLLKEKPLENIIYVSCNPNRGIEDIAQLRDFFEIRSVKLFDQFPQTPHVEMIACLIRK